MMVLPAKPNSDAANRLHLNHAGQVGDLAQRTILDRFDRRDRHVVPFSIGRR